MMTQEDFNNFKKIPYEAVVEIIGTQYIFDYGESKTTDIMRKMGDSSKLAELFVRIHVSGMMPTPNDLLYIINGLSFFLFVKSETICVAAVSFAAQGFKEIPDLSNEYIVGYLMEMVYKCERMKFNKSDTFYTRVYKKLAVEYDSENHY